MTRQTLGRISIIDDEEEIREVFRLALEAVGFVVVIGGSGTDLDRHLAEGELVGIICDQALPDEGGLAIHARLKPTIDDRKIAFLLVHAQDVRAFGELKEDTLLARGIIGLEKPITMARLRAAMRNEIDRLRPPSDP